MSAGTRTLDEEAICALRLSDASADLNALDACWGHV